MTRTKQHLSEQAFEALVHIAMSEYDVPHMIAVEICKDMIKCLEDKIGEGVHLEEGND